MIKEKKEVGSKGEGNEERWKEERKKQVKKKEWREGIKHASKQGEG